MNNRIIVKGEGIPIVLIHGMGGPNIWLPIIEELKNKFQVIVPIFPGFLKEDVNFRYSDNLYVDFLINVREFLNINKWNVVGVSMGGRTSINYALKEANQISSLTLIDSIGVGYMSPILKLPFMKKVFPFLIQSMLRSESNRIKLAKQDFVDDNGVICKKCISWFNELTAEKIVRQNFAKILSNVGIPQKQWKKQLRKFNIPTQILWASDDQTAPLHWGISLNSMIPNSELKVLNGFKHMAILEQSDFFINQMVDFIN